MATPSFVRTAILNASLRQTVHCKILQGCQSSTVTMTMASPTFIHARNHPLTIYVIARVSSMKFFLFLIAGNADFCAPVWEPRRLVGRDRAITDGHSGPAWSICHLRSPRLLFKGFLKFEIPRRLAILVSWHFPRYIFLAKKGIVWAKRNAALRPKVGKFRGNISSNITSITRLLLQMLIIKFEVEWHF